MSFDQRCEVTTIDGIVVVFVDGAPWMTFDKEDVACERLAMVQLAVRGVGTHEEIASAFGLKSLSVDRFRKAFREHGVTGLLPKKKGPKGPRVTGGKIDHVIVAAKRAGQLTTDIAAKLGISRPAVTAALRRLNYTEREPSRADPPGAQTARGENLEPTDEESSRPRESEAKRPIVDSSELSHVVEARDPSPPIPPTAVASAVTIDTDPSNRSIDRALAVNGLLDDAAPLFGDADGIRDVGALLAIPLLTQQGVFYEALRVFSGIGPSFYGLRTTIVCLCLLMMLNLSRLQDVMQREPRSVGKLLGLDRSPEIKTLRRKVRTLAQQGRSLQWMDALAKRQLDEPKSDTMWLYLDGHVSVYSGKHRLREHHVACLRAARPSVMDYWVNQPQGEPLLVITGTPQEGLVRQVPLTIEKVKSLAPERPITVVFDREGWSPQLFATIKKTAGVHFLTYRKAAKGKLLPRLAEQLFTSRTIEVNGREVTYDLADTHVRISYSEGRRHKHVELRQITRRKADGKQTHVLTDDREKPAAELASRMFGRWSQENYFKYAGEHRDLDALVTQEMDPADGTRLVPNPERAKPKAQLANLRVQLRAAHEQHGRQQLGSEPTHCSSEADHAVHVQTIEADIERLKTQYSALPARVPWSTTDKDRDGVQPCVEVRRLMHVFRIVAHRAESALLELLRPQFPDWQHEGRALTRAILHSSGYLRVTATDLHVTLDPLASPYKTRALTALCAELTRLDSTFPGTNLKMVFHVNRCSEEPGRDRAS
jgi:DNA-binding MarR family transcriptional regulator